MNQEEQLLETTGRCCGLFSNECLASTVSRMHLLAKLMLNWHLALCWCHILVPAWLTWNRSGAGTKMVTVSLGPMETGAKPTRPKSSGSEAMETCPKKPSRSTFCWKRTALRSTKICTMLNLWLNTTYFKYREDFYRQKNSCAMNSPVSSIAANLYMEESENRAISTFTGIIPIHWFRCVVNTWVKIQA